MSTTNEKLEATVLLLLEKCNPQRPGVTVLLKMLFLADQEHYRRNLRTITGAQYVALERGPVVDGYKTIFEKMVNEKTMRMREVTIQGQEKKKTEYRLGSVLPDRSLFSESEIDVIDEIVERYGRMTGNQLSEWTHLGGPWTLVWNPRKPGNRIPEVLFRWYDNMSDAEDIEEAKQLISEPETKRRIQELNAESSRPSC